MPTDKSELALLEEIGAKLDRLIALAAIQGKGQDEQIQILRGLGFDSRFVGALVGMKPDAVRQRKSWKNGC